MVMKPRRETGSAAVAPMGAPLIAYALTVAILLGGLPILTGAVVIADSKPALTVDLCYPLSGASYNLDQSEAPLIPGLITASLPAYCGSTPEFVTPSFPQVSKAPDPPPPKIGA